jgi:DNA-binding PadR family transcriptional regulator
MSTRLVILGLLRDRDLYGYEIKQIIQEHMADWTSIAFGSIYFALDKMAEDGLVKKVGTEQKGGRPSRSVYRITDAGRAEFLRLLRQVWREPERNYFTLDIGLFFMAALPLDETKGYLGERSGQLEAWLQGLAAHRAEQLAQAETPRLAAAIFDHAQAHLQAELDWTGDLLEKIERGQYL